MEPPNHSLDDLRIRRESGEPRRSRPLWVVVVAIVLLLLGAASLYIFFKPAAVEVKTVAARESISTSASGSGADRTVLNASGYVTARREATVSSKVTGKVVEVLIEEGMKVHQDQVLARLDDTNVKAQLRFAEAQLDAARAAFDETKVRIHEAELELKRTTQLAKENIARQADLDTAQAQLDSLKARLVQQESQARVSESEVATWRQQLDDTIIRAPFAGIVTSKNAQPGEMISPVSAGGGFTRTGICTIVDMESLEIEIDVNESYINRVSPGQPVEAALDAYPDWKIPAKVIAIIPTADRQKSTVRVRVGFDKLDPRILPQMSIKVAFRERETGQSAGNISRGVIIPAAALTERAGKQVVLISSNGKAERRAVTSAGRQGTNVLITAGLSTGERVILNAPASLSDGSRIKESTL